MYKGPLTILSENRKTGFSIDLPIAGHCRPTANCARACYAKRGPQCWPLSTRKHEWVSQYLEGPNLLRLAKECHNRSVVRLSGSGDMKPAHARSIIRLADACPDTTFWGMTRKTEVARMINGARLPNLRILVTVDATSPTRTWNYDGTLCYGPRHPQDSVPRDKRILTVFPAHYVGRVQSGMTHHLKDCPAVWHDVSGCIACRRCFSWW